MSKILNLILEQTDEHGKNHPDTVAHSEIKNIGLKRFIYFILFNYLFAL